MIKAFLGFLFLFRSVLREEGGVEEPSGVVAKCELQELEMAADKQHTSFVRGDTNKLWIGFSRLRPVDVCKNSTSAHHIDLN